MTASVYVLDTDLIDVDNDGERLNERIISQGEKMSLKRFEKLFNEERINSYTTFIKFTEN